MSKGCDTREGHGAEGHEMRKRHPHRVTRRAAEQLLGGAAGDSGEPREGPENLARLLTAAATVPVSDGAAPGEEAAVTAFWQADLSPAGEPRRTPRRPAVSAKALTVKMAAAAIAAVTLGGVSYAVAAASLKAPFGAGHAHPAISRTASDVSEGRSANGLAYPANSLAGACNAYLAFFQNTEGGTAKATRTREFENLIKAAGGAEKAATFCRSLLGALHRPHPPGTPSAARPGLPVSVPASLPPSLPASLPPVLPTTLPSLPLPGTASPPIPHPTNLPTPHP
jgi:hypothetical protein